MDCVKNGMSNKDVNAEIIANSGKWKNRYTTYCADL